MILVVIMIIDGQESKSSDSKSKKGLQTRREYLDNVIKEADKVLLR